MSTMNRLTSSFGPDHDMPAKTVWSRTVIVATVLMMTSGTMNTIGFAVQSDKYGYKHGLCQTSLMFIGEYVNLIILFTKLVPIFVILVLL